MSSILLVEDAPDVSDLIFFALTREGMRVDVAENLAKAKEKIKQSTYDVVLLDIHLPDGDGFDLLPIIQASDTNSGALIFFLTSRDDNQSKIAAFGLGADDYIVKPVNLLELVARMSSRLKKKSTQQEKPEFYVIDHFEFNLYSQRLTLLDTKTEIDLSPREFKILFSLAVRPDQVLSRRDILKKINGLNIHVSQRTIDTYVCSIRKKLKELGKCVESVSGEGYRYNPRLVETESEQSRVNVCA